MSDDNSEDTAELAEDRRLALTKERNELLRQIEDWVEVPMLVLAFVWVALVIFELIWAPNAAFEAMGTVIWGIFGLHVIVEFVLAPHKMTYLKRNWLTVIALLFPPLRVFRLPRALRVIGLTRAGRGLRLVRVLGSVNSGMRALGASLRRRGFGYVCATTLLVTLVGAAGMYAFENGAVGGLTSYGEGLWWTAMMMTTMGSGYWPETTEGRVLCVFLAVHAFAVFGYLTATLATFFIGRDAELGHAEPPGSRQFADLHAEVSALREDIRLLSRRAGDV